MSATITQQVLADLDDNQATQLKILLERGIKIPPQPRVVERFRQQVVRGEKDLRALAQTLGEDPGIVSMLFKVVQSPAYRQYQPFDAVEHILQAIGIEQTRHLVEAIALRAAFPARGQSTAMESYWSRSRQVARLAMIIADARHGHCRVEPDQAYLAGVFHDCGVPVLMQRFPAYCEAMALNNPSKWAEIGAEDRKFFADHAVVGYLVARHWRLPDFVADVVRFHHDLDGSSAARPLVAILQYAVELYLRDQQVGNPEWPAQQGAVLDELGLAPIDEENFADDVLAALDACA